MIEDGLTFALSANFQHLADAERTFFAARVGSGITDLYMNALGYTWRANAACLSSVLDPHTDFLYEGGNATGHGVVLAEAHGSFAKNASAASVHLKAKNKYLEQVKPHLGKNSEYGKVIHGYCVAFGSAPRTSGAFLSLSETQIKKPKGKKDTPPGPIPPDISRERDTSTSIALAAHRSNFFLMGSDQIVSWIDWIRSRDRPLPAMTPVVFLRLQYAGRRYLIPASSLWWLDPLHDWWPEFFDNERQWRHMLRWSLRPRSGRWPHLGCFAIDERAGRAFLGTLTGLIQSGADPMPDTVTLPEPEPTGFGFGDETMHVVGMTGAISMHCSATAWLFWATRNEAVLAALSPGLQRKGWRSRNGQRTDRTPNKKVSKCSIGGTRRISTSAQEARVAYMMSAEACRPFAG